MVFGIREDSGLGGEEPEIAAESMALLRPIEAGVKRFWRDGSWYAGMLIAACREPAAVAFYRELQSQAFRPDYLVNVLPTQGVIYLVVPKAASTRIRATLGAIDGRRSRSINPNRRQRFRGPQGPRSMTVRSFHRLATSPATLRFSFVRNPYARLVSCWADKFQDKPLAPGRSRLIDDYLASRRDIDATLPAGADQTLSFEQFVTFAAASASLRLDPHLQLQDDILSMPGIALDFIGRTESFDADFARVLHHIGVSDAIKGESHTRLNPSHHRQWPDYYTASLASAVHRAYQRDFDRFGYPRAISG
jgi:hypothetical protein